MNVAFDLPSYRRLRLGGRALFGAPIAGVAPVYYIYVDEAGTSEPEPVTVVVGVIIHADKGWTVAASRVRELIEEYVPKKFQNGFVFHAKSVWGDRRYRDEWPMEDRLAFISAMVALPRELGFAVALGKVRRDARHVLSKLPKAESDHLMAFAHCMWRANKFVRDWAKKERSPRSWRKTYPIRNQNSKQCLILRAFILDRL